MPTVIRQPKSACSHRGVLPASNADPPVCDSGASGITLTRRRNRTHTESRNNANVARFDPEAGRGARDNNMLMRTEHRESASKYPVSKITARHALWALIAISTILRLAWSASVGAAFDEPYYIQYIQHPAMSYFDHPPMVALLGALGLAVTGDAFSVFGLRLGFILLFAGSMWLMARLTTRFYGEKAGLLAALALERLRLLRHRGCCHRAAGRAAPFLLAPDSRPAGRCSRRPGPARALARIRRRLGRGDVKQVPRRPPTGRCVAAYRLLAPGSPISP